MKVAVHCQSTFDTSRGTETVVRNISKGLSKKIKVDLIAGSKKKGFSNKNLKVYAYPFLSRKLLPPDTTSQYRNTIECSTFFVSTVNHFKKHKYDVIHVQLPINLMLKSATSDKILCHIHAPKALKDFRTILESIEADGYVACSNYIAEKARKIVKRPVYTIYNGVDIKFFEPKKVKKENKLIILFMGALLMWKGFPYLLRAFKNIEKKIKNAELWIAGIGVDEPKIRSMAKSLGLKKVKFLGFVQQKQLPFIISKCDVFIVPSPEEAFGITIIEAMSCGKPVISTNASGPKEIITKDCGFLIKPSSSKAIEEAILNLKNYDLIKMGEKARKRVENNFTWQHAVDSLMKVYRKIK